MTNLNAAFLLFIAIAGVAAVTILARYFYVYYKLKGKRLVTCPENHQFATVGMDAARGARESLLKEPALHLNACTRWPEKQDCAQDCLPQITSDQVGRRVPKIVADYYRGKACAFCGNPVSDVDVWWLHQEPGFVDSQMHLVSWETIPPEQLPAAFAAWKPVCWSCSITETFRKEHASLLLDRPEYKHTVKH